MSDLQTVLEQVKNESDFFKKAKLILSLKQGKMPLNKISAELGLKPSYISHILRLNKLPELIIDGYYSDAISISHLFIISRLNNDADMIEVYENTLTGNLTALQTEELVRQKLYNVKNDGRHLGLDELEEFIKLMEKNEFKAKVIQTRVKGKIILEVKGNLTKTTLKLREAIALLKSEPKQGV